MIVLAINPIFGGDSWPGKQGFEISDRVRRVWNACEGESTDFFYVFGLASVALIDGSFVRQFLRGDIDDARAIITHDHVARIGYLTDLGPGQIPFVENPLYL